MANNGVRILGEELLDMTPEDAWDHLFKEGNRLLDIQIELYLKSNHDHQKNGWHVYLGRWKKYVREKKQPYYDVVRLYYIYNRMKQTVTPEPNTTDENGKPYYNPNVGRKVSNQFPMK